MQLSVDFPQSIMVKHTVSTEVITIPDAVRGLALLSGLSQQELAVRSGVSPGSVTALFTRTPKALLIWLRLMAGFGCSVVVTWQDREFVIAMPKVGFTRSDREWSAWRKRRIATTINHLRAAEPKSKRSVLEERARTYANNEEARLRTRLKEWKDVCANVGGHLRANGLRSAAQVLTAKTGAKAEELTLVAGISLSSSQLMLSEQQDGRLGTIHRLLSALAARVYLRLPHGSLDIALCPPGEWRPGMTDIDEDPDEKPLSAARSVNFTPNRSRLNSEEMLELYDRGESIGEIARKACVSRQRVHKLAMDHQRPHRRQQKREQRVALGREVLGMES